MECGSSQRVKVLKGGRESFAVTVKAGTVTVGHIPQCILSICSIFIWQSGTFKCTVMGNKQYLSDLLQGGLKLFCILNFSTDDVKESDKTEKLVKASLSNVSIMDSTEIQSSTVSIKLESCREKLQNSCTKLHLPHSEEMPIYIDDSGDELPKKKSCCFPIIYTQLIVVGDRLTDQEINHSQNIL